MGVTATTFAGSQGGCTSGGVKVTRGTEADQFVCNGTNGTNGINGTNGTNGKSVTVTTTTCGNGMAGIVVTPEGGSPSTICNGKDGTNGTAGTNGTNGTDGADGKSVTVTTTTCGNGMAGIIVTPEGGSPNTICNGKDGTNGVNGTNGTDGADGKSVTVTTTTCGNGMAGIIVTPEGGSPSTICNGKDGTNGVNGTNGTNGADGKSVTVTPIVCGNGMAGITVTPDDGTPRTICNGTNGTNGINGSNGSNGVDGKDAPVGLPFSLNATGNGEPIPLPTDKFVFFGKTVKRYFKDASYALVTITPLVASNKDVEVQFSLCYGVDTSAGVPLQDADNQPVYYTIPIGQEPKSFIMSGMVSPGFTADLFVGACARAGTQDDSLVFYSATGYGLLYQ